MGIKLQLISIEQGNRTGDGDLIHHGARAVSGGLEPNGKIGTECTQRLAMHDMADAVSIRGIEDLVAKPELTVRVDVEVEGFLQECSGRVESYEYFSEFRRLTNDHEHCDGRDREALSKIIVLGFCFFGGSLLGD